MTNEQIKRFRRDLMVIYDLNKEALRNVQYDWQTPEEALIIGISECLRLEKEAQTHDGVISCLESSIECLKHAAVDYYVSTK